MVYSMKTDGNIILVLRRDTGFYIILFCIAAGKSIDIHQQLKQVIIKIDNHFLGTVII